MSSLLDCSFPGGLSSIARLTLQSIHARIPGSPDQALAPHKADVLSPRLSVVFGQPEVNRINQRRISFGYCKILWLDIPVDEVLLMEILVFTV